MNKTNLLNKLMKIANTFDENGLFDEANVISNVMNKVANRFDDQYIEEFGNERTPGRSEEFESDMPGELGDEPDMDEINQEGALREAITDYLIKLLGEDSTVDVNAMADETLQTIKDRANRLSSDF